MLLDRSGHLKLADFGTCMKMDRVSAEFHIHGVVYSGHAGQYKCNGYL